MHPLHFVPGLLNRMDGLHSSRDDDPETRSQPLRWTPAFCAYMCTSHLLPPTTLLVPALFTGVPPASATAIATAHTNIQAPVQVACKQSVFLALMCFQVACAQVALWLCAWGLHVRSARLCASAVACLAGAAYVDVTSS